MNSTTVTEKTKYLDKSGRCCGRKPLVYKRPTHRLFCSRCDREFTPAGVQVANWAWKPTSDGQFTRTHHGD